MKKWCVMLLSLSIACALSIGCSNSQTNSMENTAENDSREAAASASSTSKEETKYTLDASAYKEDDRYYLNITTNLKLSEEHYEGPPVDGEGHIHLYLNGALVGPIKDTSPYRLPLMLKGSNTIKLVLAENNHPELGVTKELTIDVEE